MLLRRAVLARDSRNNNQPVTGLTPSWVHITNLNTREPLDPVECPKFFDLGGGQYAFSFRVEPGEHFFGQVDLGPQLADGWDRFVDFEFAFIVQEQTGGDDS